MLPVPTNRNNFAITRNLPLNFNAKNYRWRITKRQLVWGMGVMAVYHSKVLNWNAEAFVDEPVKRWPPKRAKYGGKILVKTGRLRSSIGILKSTPNLVHVGTTVPYGIKHQRGIGFPERQFTGHSAVLSRATADFIIANMNRVMAA